MVKYPWPRRTAENTSLTKLSAAQQQKSGTFYPPTSLTAAVADI